MSAQRPPLDLGSRIRGQWRVGLTTIMVVTAAAVALVQILLIARAWQLAGDELTFYPAGEEAITRLAVMAQVLTYLPFQASSLDVVAGAGAAALAFALIAHRAASDLAGGWRRATWTAAVAAGAVGVVTALVRLLVQANVLISTNDSVQSVFGPPDTLSGLTRVLDAGVDGLLWAAALIVGLLWRTQAEGATWDENTEPAGDERALSGEEDVTGPVDEPGASPAAPPSAYAGPVAPSPPPGPRLQADGSSDSGYDEFHFRT